MKRLMIITAMLGMLATGCKKEDSKTVTPTPTPTPGTEWTYSTSIAGKLTANCYTTTTGTSRTLTMCVAYTSNDTGTSLMDAMKWSDGVHYRIAPRRRSGDTVMFTSPAFTKGDNFTMRFMRIKAGGVTEDTLIVATGH